MTIGTVKYFNPSNGHGLISTANGARDVAVYQSEVDQARLGQLAAGQKLSFDIQSCKKKLKAINLWATFGDR
jgi:CspA family cold shock protein